MTDLTYGFDTNYIPTIDQPYTVTVEIINETGTKIYASDLDYGSINVNLNFGSQAQDFTDDAGSISVASDLGETITTPKTYSEESQATFNFAIPSGYVFLPYDGTDDTITRLCIMLTVNNTTSDGGTPVTVETVTSGGLSGSTTTQVACYDYSKQDTSVTHIYSLVANLPVVSNGDTSTISYSADTSITKWYIYQGTSTTGDPWYSGGSEGSRTTAQLTEGGYFTLYGEGGGKSYQQQVYVSVLQPLITEFSVDSDQEGVTYDDDGSITVNAGTSFDISWSVNNAQCVAFFTYGDAEPACVLQRSEVTGWSADDPFEGSITLNCTKAGKFIMLAFADEKPTQDSTYAFATIDISVASPALTAELSQDWTYVDATDPIDVTINCTDIINATSVYYLVNDSSERTYLFDDRDNRQMAPDTLTSNSFSISDATRFFVVAEYNVDEAPSSQVTSASIGGTVVSVFPPNASDLVQTNFSNAQLEQEETTSKVLRTCETVDFTRIGMKAHWVQNENSLSTSSPITGVVWGFNNVSFEVEDFGYVSTKIVNMSINFDNPILPDGNSKTVALNASVSWEQSPQHTIVDSGMICDQTILAFTQDDLEKYGPPRLAIGRYGGDGKGNSLGTITFDDEVDFTKMFTPWADFSINDGGQRCAVWDLNIYSCQSNGVNTYGRSSDFPATGTSANFYAKFGDYDASKTILNVDHITPAAPLTNQNGLGFEIQQIITDTMLDETTLNFAYPVKKILRYITRLGYAYDGNFGYAQLGGAHVKLASDAPHSTQTTYTLDFQVTTSTGYLARSHNYFDSVTLLCIYDDIPPDDSIEPNFG